MRHAEHCETDAMQFDALKASMAWVDMSSRWVEQWVAWQQAIWQPVMDLQARWLECWPDLCTEPFTARGAEQLA